MSGAALIWHIYFGILELINYIDEYISVTQQDIKKYMICNLGYLRRLNVIGCIRILIRYVL